MFPLVLLSLLVSPITAMGAVASSPERQLSHTLVPVLYYSPDTQAALGATTVSSYRAENEERWQSSTLRNMVILTQRRQLMFQTSPELYLSDGKVLIRGALGYFDFPAFYYGIGSGAPQDLKDAYTARSIRLRLNPALQVGNRMFAGVLFEAGWTRLSDFAPGSSVAGQVAAIGTFQRQVGVGPTFRLDRRDANFFPTSGYLLDAGLQFFEPSGALGRFQRLTADFRSYHATGESGSVLAFQAAGAAVAGDNIPFYQLPSIGGGRNLRGYKDGRYPGEAMVYSQAEWRARWSSRWGWAAFAGAGTLFGSREQEQRLFPVGGGGVRFAVMPKEQLNLRADIAFGRGAFGFYFMIGESF